METSPLLYNMPNAMEPLFPDDSSGELENLATKLIYEAGKLSSCLHPITANAIADFLRPMNSYYSNLIEGHDTHPLDIEKALNNDFSNDKNKRDLQKEAHAHIILQSEIYSELNNNKNLNPFSSDFIKSIHKRFYNYLPDDFLKVKSKHGEVKIVVPGETRKDEVEVGRHIAPKYESLDVFLKRFEEFYNPINISNHSKVRRIISIAAAHHRLVWIHPFLDGNGRVVRLFSDTCFKLEQLDALGLWSISRGLARENEKYKSTLANADLKRYNDFDGRGNLSNKMLVEFCRFFLETSIDQIQFMKKIIDIDGMLKRIDDFVALMKARKDLKSEAKYLLIDLFLKGKISKPEALRITDLSDKTLKVITDKLTEMGLMESKKEGILMMYYVKYPIRHSPLLFPGLYPGNKESEMI
jgi:Fic family protein